MKIFEPLPQGEYRVFSKDKTVYEAIINGHDFIRAGETIAKCDGKWVYFYNDDKKVWGCNPFYAVAHFIFERIK